VKKQIKIRRSLALLALAKPVEALWAVLVAIYPQEIKAIANPTLLNKPVKSVGYAVRTLLITTLLNKGTRSVPYMAKKMLMLKLNLYGAHNSTRSAKVNISSVKTITGNNWRIDIRISKIVFI
jgi:hypothetical protein